VARLTLSNPGRRGALDHPILDALASTVPSLDARCLIVTGEGDSFSAGYDLSGLPDGILAEEADRLVAHPFAAAIDAVEQYEYPTLAALNGHAIGGGLELALALAGEIASNAPIAQRGNKRVIRELLSGRGQLGSGIEQELLELRRSSLSSEDFQEAVRAFADKRRPEWKDR